MEIDQNRQKSIEMGNENVKKTSNDIQSKYFSFFTALCEGLSSESLIMIISSPITFIGYTI